MITLYNEKNEKVKLIGAFEFNDADMGESSISATVSFDKEQDFHPDWYVEYNKEKFRLGVRKPTGKKDTSSLSTSYTLVFKSEREDLKRYTFMDFVELGTGNPQPNSYKVPLYATLSEFVHRFNVNLNYYMGSRWRMVLPSNYSESGNAVHIVFDNITLWDVLLKIHETWGVRWKIVPQSDVLNIQVGFPDEEIEHVFEYGKDNGLVSVERNNALERIITRLRGRGGERNLPPDYFHSGDPDTNAFLQATYFQNLMPKSYRDYIKGYNSGSGSGSWAYNQGVADKRAGVNIAPVDYAVSSKESLWGVSYGAIEPNESIYPTLQGASRNGSRLDTVIDVEEVFADSPAIESDRETESRDDIKITSQGICLSEGNELYDSCLSPIVIQPGVAPFVITKPFNTIDLKFKVESLYKLLANLDWVAPAFLGDDVKLDGLIELYNTDSAEVVAKEGIANTPYVEIHAENIPEGIYAFKIRLEWIAENQPAGTIMTCNFLFYDIKVDQYSSATTKEGYKSTFDIWIKDIWNEPRQTGEKDEDYIYRVWERLAVSEEMTVMFSDGLLAGEDYEFRVVGVTSSADNLRSAILSAIHLDDTKSLFGERSAWRLTLQKSEAELEASGRYLPNRMQQAKPGNHFFFVNIAMPYNPYVYDAEARVQSYLETQLALKDEEYPSFTISPSPVFCKDFEEVGKLKAGSVIRVRNLALIGDSYLPLHIQSITKRYSENKLNPDWTVTVSDQIVASGNPVETLEGDVNILSSQVYSNKEAVKQAVRQLSTTFLRKDGVADVSYSPSTFSEKVKIGSDVVDTDFSRGDVNGKGFGVYTDGDGNRVVEADILVGRIAARFNEVHLNQVTYSGGKQVFSAAGLQVSKVENTGDAWRCYFDNKNGSIKNLFKEGDGAFSQHFTTEGYTSYWRRVVGLGADYIDLSLTDCMENSGDPMVGDSIAQLGNKEDKSRQAALVIDVVREGGGLVTWYDDINEYTLKEKDSVNIGRLSSEIDGETFWKTWLQVFGAAYIGNKEKTQYVHYEDGVLKISGTLEVGTKLSDGRNLEQALKDATPEGYEDFVKKVLGDLENLQGQVDGAIESFFYEYEPTLNNYPAIEWNTDELKTAHLNDTFTNLKDGRSWRWTKSGDVYGWTEITDTATVEALRLAGLAKDTADGKRRIFTTTPTVNSVYDEGDLWVNATYGELYYNDILRANTAKKAGVPFSIDHWELASKYTDDKKAEELFGALEYLKKALQESTLIEGGLIQSSLLALGYTQDGEFKVMSGTNGVYMPTELGGGIAAWYGGPMIDKIAKPEYSTYAQSVFRFDGSGYLAGGNIKWDSEGAGSVAGGGLSWDKYGNVFLGPDIKITSSGDETLGSVLTMLNRISDWFTLQEIDGESFLITRHNIASYGEVSSGGIGSGSSGEGGGGSGVGNILPFTSLAAYGSTEKLTEVFSAYTTKLISDRVGVLEERNPINLSSMWGALASSGSEKIDVSHIPDLSGVYLPKSGGTINGNIILNGNITITREGIPLYINSTSDSIPPAINFFKNLVNYGGIGMSNKNTPCFLDTNNTPYTLIHSGNYADTTDKRYLQLSGGTINSNTSETSLLLSTSTNPQLAGLVRNAGTGGYGLCLWNASGGRLGLLEDGTPHYNQNTLIHSGNIGSQSVNYASSAGNAEKVGGVSVTKGYNKPWGTIPAITPNGYMDVGKHFEFHYDNTTGSDYSTVLGCTGNYGNIVNLPSASGTLALRTDNVASATKLQTARTIWGQSFDGTQSVSGSLIGVDFIKFDSTNTYGIHKGSAFSGGLTENDLVYSAQNHRFFNGSNNVFTIKNNGNVLIGETEDNGAKLQVNGSASIAGNITQSTGYLLLRGATQSSAWGMAANRYANALGTYATALGNSAFAGVRTGDSSYPYAYMEQYATLPITFNGETVYGLILPPAATYYYTYNGTERSVTNPSSSVAHVFVLVNGGDDLVESSTTPFDKCALIFGAGTPVLGLGNYIKSISVIEGSVRGVMICTWSASVNRNFTVQSYLYAMRRSSNSDYSGNSSVASGYYSVASGNSSVASGNSSVASGYYSVASGNYSVASGYYSVASGNYSVASGYYSVASGTSSVASGTSSVASGTSSVASGNYSVVTAMYGKSGTAHQTVIGKYNAVTSDAFIIGWGNSDSDRKNVFAVSGAGNTLVGGTLSVTGASTFTGKTTHIGGISTQSIKIGGATLTWDAENECLIVDKNFAAYGEVSSGGIGDGSSSGGNVNLLQSWSGEWDSSYALSAGLGVDLNNRLVALEANGGINLTSMWSALATDDSSKVIHSSHIPNLSSKYLPLGGGTITGRTNIKFNGWPFIAYYSSDTLYGFIGFSDVGVPSMYNGTSWNTLIHSGNIGSQNVSYATNAGNAAKVAGLSVNIGSRSSWGTIPAITDGGWMDVGKHLEFHFDNTANVDYSTLLACVGNYNNVVCLPSASGTLALLTDNVASATKLQDNTAFTAWGQTFFKDGVPKNVSGGLSATTGSFSSTLSVLGKTTLNNVDINANYELVCNGSASFTTIKPISANTYDLGTDFFRWKNAYINTLDLSGNISVGGALSVAQATTLSGSLSVAKTTTLSGTLSVSQLASFHNVEVGSGYSLNCFGNGYFTYIYPQSNNTYNLGSSSAQWNNLFAQNINCATGELNISAKGVINFTNTAALSSSTPTIYAPVITSFYLLAPNGGQIGMSNVRWENVYSKYGDFENSIYIGSARVWWDSENDCLRVSKNFASDGEVSAGGVNSDSSDSDSSNAPVLGGTISGDLDVTGKVTIGGLTTMNSGFLSKSIQVGSMNNDSIGFGNCSIDLYGSLYLNNPTTGKWASFTISDTSETVVINRALSVVSLTQTSDIRFKQVIDDVCLSSKIIANAPMFRFTWADNQDGKVHIGTSAQYWMNYAPELTTLVDNKYTLDYATLGVLMGKSNATEIEQLKERVRILEQEVECYRRMLNAN